MNYFWMGLIGVLVGALGMDIIKYMEVKGLKEALDLQINLANAQATALEIHESLERTLENKVNLLTEEIKLLESKIELMKKLP